MHAVEHCGLGHADHGNVEQFPGRKQAGIAEGRDDRAVKFPVAFREHFQRDGAADLGFGARRYIGHATWRGEGRSVMFPAQRRAVRPSA